jgi:hypothetical protein
MWLETTPWTSQKPLPLGPIHLVAQDVLIIGLTLVVAWPLHHSKTFHILQVFLTAYLLSMSLPLWWTGEKLIAFSVWFGLGGMTYTCLNIPLFAMAAACTYGLAYWGLRDSLARFPWTLSPWMRAMQGLEPMQFQSWPYNKLAPKFIPDLGITLPNAILTSLLVPWWYFVALSFIKGPGKFEAAPHIYFIVAIPLIAGRLLIYASGFAPPISFLGRIVTGRLLIPGYDQVFVAPLLALIVAIWLPKILIDQGFGFVEARAVSLVWVYFIILILGPSLKTWRLTGNHRIMSPVATKSGLYVRVG